MNKSFVPKLLREILWLTLGEAHSSIVRGLVLFEISYFEFVDSVDSCRAFDQVFLLYLF